MREFKFSDNRVEFMFGGKVFGAPLDVASVEMGKVGKLLSEAANNIENKELVEGNVNNALDIIDGFLGEGSIDEIFEGRGINIVDVCDLVNFISSVVMEKKAEKEKIMKEQLAKAETRRFVAQLQ